MQAKTDPLATHAAEVFKLAGEVARRYFRGRLDVEFKADESPVTQADREVETVARNYLLKHFPDHGIFGEEHGIEGADRDHMWIIDPIDGTRSFLSGQPLFGFLLGHLEHGEADFAVVGIPTLNEVLTGRKGKGATLNGQPVRVSRQKALDQSVLYINEGEKIYRHHPEIFSSLLNAGQTRRLAYDCYPHMLVAMGHVDAVIDYDLQPYDYLPVSTVVSASGGIMTDWQGNALGVKSGTKATITAATQELHAELLALVSG
ncbi:MAG: inositol monophosphatase [Rhodobacteraceae bacterium]|nr:inositol monophosphatase [Paracoccaceae bacterium]